MKYCKVYKKNGTLLCEGTLKEVIRYLHTTEPTFRKMRKRKYPYDIEVEERKEIGVVHYDVYDRDGQYVCYGTAEQIKKCLGLKRTDTVYQYACRHLKGKKCSYVIVRSKYEGT